MFNSHSWLNSDQTLFTAWTGSTFFTSAQMFDVLKGTINPITLIGWIITTVLAMIAAYSKWRVNRAEELQMLSEARRNNAEAQKIETELSMEYQSIIED